MESLSTSNKGLGLESDLIYWSLFAKTNVKPVSIQDREENDHSAEDTSKLLSSDHAQESKHKDSKSDCKESSGPMSSIASSVSLFKSYAYQSFPPEVQLCLSSIPGTNFGVMATVDIPGGVLIGPYEGKLIDAEDKFEDNANMWEIICKNHLRFFIDGSDINNSSWMRFIQCARNQMEQNASAFQYQGRIYYRLLHDVAAGQEILVWYDDSYPQHMGIPLMDRTVFNDYKEPTNISKKSTIERKRLSSSHEKRDNEFEPVSKIIRTDDASSDSMKNTVFPKMNSLSQISPLSVRHENSSNNHDNLSSQNTNTPSHHERSPDRHNNMHSNISNSHHSNSPDRLSNSLSDDDNSSSNDSLSDHSNSSPINSGPEPFKCVQCGTTFAQRAVLQMHRCPKQMNAPYHCGCCSLSYSNPSELRSHVKIHVGEKPFKCGFCGRSFVGATTLNNHIRIHTGQKIKVKNIDFKISQKDYQKQYLPS